MAFRLRHRRALSATACAVLAILATSATGATSASALRRFARDVAGVERSGQPRLRNRVRPTGCCGIGSGPGLPVRLWGVP